MRLRVLSLVASVVLACPGIPAQTTSPLNPQTVEYFNEIEHQYFGRNFNAESYDARAQRIEKIMFGGIQGGDPNQRIANIVSFVLKANTDTPDTPDNSVVDNGDEYPHITSLENLILGQGYPKQELTARLSTLEAKAFGKSSTSKDLSARTDALDQYVQQTLNKNPFQLNASTDADNSPTQNSAAAPDDDDQPDYPHIDTLEKQILGATYIGQPLADRISRMEVKAYGKASPNPDLSQRTDDLDAYVSNVLHVKSFEQTQERPDDSQPSNPQNSQRKKQIAALVANSLLGMAGLGFIGGVMPQAMSTQRRDDQVVHAPNQVQAEDPLVNQTSMQPANTRMITKVSWCEMQTFGHTSPNLHLIDRLSQLNHELNYAPGQSGMDLMDDMDALMTKVAQKQSATTM